MTASAATSYNQALLDARRRGFALGAEALARLARAFESAATAIELILQQDTGDSLTRARASMLRAQILGVVQVLQQRVQGAVTGSVETTIAEVVAIHQRITTELMALEYVPPGLNAGFAQLNARVPAVIAARRQGSATYETLIQRNIQGAGPELDNLITQSVSRGVAPRQLAKDITALLRERESALDPDAYGIDPSQVANLRRLQSDSRRIAVTETMNALREANNQAMQVSPVVRAVRWQRSGRHGGLPSTPDECDVLAECDFYGFGPGYYPPERFPLAPHPYCACVQGGPTLLRPPSEWADPKPRAPALDFDSCKMLDSGAFLAMSPRAKARAKQNLRSVLGAVDAAALTPVAPVTPPPAPPAKDLKKQPSATFPPANPGATETLDKYTLPNGRLTPERQELHDVIVRDHFQGVTPPGGTPTVWVMGGGPAAGKSVMLDQLDTPNAVHIDPDNIKSFLPEYREGVQKGLAEVASIVHEESSALAKRVAAEAVRGNYNLLMDGTGDNTYESLAKKVAGYRANGARVVANYVVVDTDTAVERAIKRGQRTGRFVPETYIRSVHDNIRTILPRAIKEGLFDELTVWDNNGASARKIAEYRNGTLTVLDREAWGRFTGEPQDLFTFKGNEVRPAPDRDDLQKLGESRETRSWQYGLTRTENKFVNQYTGSAHQEINRALWDDPQMKDAQRWDSRADDFYGVDSSGFAEKRSLRDVKTTLDAALAKNGIRSPEEAVEVWRGVSTSAPALGGKQAFVQQFRVGQEISLPGYQSTSFDTVYPLGDAGDPERVVLEIRARRGAYVAPISNFQDEYEWLMPHNSRFRVVRIIEDVPFERRSYYSGTVTIIRRTVIQLEEIV